MSLRKKLTLSMLMIAVIPVMVLGSFYYQYFSGVLLSNVQQRELQNNSQIIYSVDNFFNSIFKISDSLLMNEELMDILQKSYEEQSSPLEGYRGKAQVDKLLYKDGYYLDGRIETIAIFPRNNSMFYYCTKENVNPSYDIHAEEWYEKIASKEGAKVLVGVHQNRLVYAFSDAARPYCVTVGRSIYSPYDSQLLGTMLININVHDLQTCWSAFKEDSQERFYLLDDENNVVFSNLTEEIGGKFFQDGLEDGISSCRIDGELYDTIVSGSKSLGWKSVKMIPRSQLDQEIAVVPYMTLLLMLILTVLAVLVSIFISKIFTRPLQELYVKLQRFEAEKSGTPQLRRAELMALQSQINSHFIYNTLNSIKWMADMQGSKRMVTALDSLIKLMQFSSKNSREVIRIQDEIDLIRDYINLINLKYFDRIFVDVHVEPGLENYETLKFLLQPIVENSIYHGFSSMVRQCTVQINITRKEDRILYEVIDNGKGMSKEKIRQALEEDHPLNSHSFNKIGLYNVNKRIQYIFGEEYGIQIDSEPGKYTRVIVEIPARIYKEEMANA